MSPRIGSDPNATDPLGGDALRFPKSPGRCHCGNPEMNARRKIARWNPNVLFSTSAARRYEMPGRLAEFQRIFWWSPATGVKTPDNDVAHYQLVFGSESDLAGVESVAIQYRAHVRRL